MSEQSLGDISHNRIHQMLEALQADGFPVGLFHRLRLDQEYRKAFVEHAQSLDRELIGKELRVDYDRDFCHPSTIIKALKERSPYGRKNSYLLKDEILLDDCATDPTRAEVRSFPRRLFILPLYKRMSRPEIRNELRRRGLVPAGAIDALCLAVSYCVGRDEGSVIVMNNDGLHLCASRALAFARNGHGDPMLHTQTLTDCLDRGTRLLVKHQMTQRAA